MTLYTDGDKPATESQILSAASAIMRGRQRVQHGGRKPVLGHDEQRDARIMLERGESINAVATYYGVAWSTIKRLAQANQPESD